jgi:phosphoglycolate phosphatase
VRLAVFDLDGTLVDSRRSIEAAMRTAFETLGLPGPSYEQTRQIVGLSLEPAIARLAPELPTELYPALAEAYRQAFIANRTAGLREPLYDGARVLVMGLKDTGWLLGIATGKSRRGVELFLERHAFADVFDAAFCADDGPGKPDPHMLRLTMQAVDRSADRTIMIGDTSFDMAMARAAGVAAQGVTWGFHTRAEIEAGGAHRIAEDFAQLAHALDDFAQG